MFLDFASFLFVNTMMVADFVFLSLILVGDNLCLYVEFVFLRPFCRPHLG